MPFYTPLSEGGDNGCKNKENRRLGEDKGGGEEESDGKVMQFFVS